MKSELICFALGAIFLILGFYNTTIEIVRKKW